MDCVALDVCVLQSRIYTYSNWIIQQELRYPLHGAEKGQLVFAKEDNLRG